MHYVMITRSAGKIVNATIATELQIESSRGTAGRKNGISMESRNDWATFDAAKEVAAALGDKYIAIDCGQNVSPRYDVIAMPQVGDAISYAFNGDYYPCGTIKSISESKKLIVGSEGHKFYRRAQSGSWKYAQTWSLVRGHVSKLNPEF